MIRKIYSSLAMLLTLLVTTAAWAGSSYHTLIVKTDGSALAWGYDAYGQLGNGALIDQANPVVIKDGVNTTVTGISMVAAGGFHSLILKTDGTVMSWGNNQYGQLGDGTTTDRSNPVTVPGLTGVIAVAAGIYHSLALKSDGTLLAWGKNWAGQVGNGSKTDQHTPVTVMNAGSNIVAIAAGDAHSLALKSDGTLLAWGNNDSGQLGNGTTRNSTSPVTVVDATGAAIQNVTAIAAGGSHNLALLADGSVLSWGYNGLGQLGDATINNHSTPVAVLDNYSNVLSGIVGISAGQTHSLALRNDGSVLAWGHNFYGQLGDGSTTDSATPTVMTTAGGTTINGISAVSAGLTHSLLLKSDGTLLACGADQYGQLGNGGSTNQRNPVAVINSGGGNTANVAGLMNVVSVTDSIPPVVSVANDIYVSSVDANGTPASNSTIQAFLLAGTATDTVDGNVTVANNAPGIFPVGTTPVTFSATDAAGNTGSAIASVHVVNTPTFSPANGSQLNSTTQTFYWTDTGASAYYVMVSSATPGGNNLYDSGVLPAGTTSVTVSGLSEDVYVRYYSRNVSTGGWDTVDYHYTRPLPAATISSPVNGSTLSGTTQQFSWADTGANGYYVMVSSAVVGGNDLYVSGFLPKGTTSVTVNGLPSDGKLIYVRLYSWKTGGWQITDSTYLATGTASMTTPAAGSTLGGSSQVFTWNNSGAAGYYLSVGRTLGQADIYQSGWINQTSLTVNNLPTGKSTPLFVRLYSWTQAGEWQVRVLNYLSSYATSITSPTAGTTLTGTSQTFSWTDVGAAGYYLDVGTGFFGHGDIYKSGFISGPVSSQLVTGLPTGGVAIYVRLYTWGSDGWRTSDALYTSAP